MTTAAHEPGRTAYEARFAGHTLGPRGVAEKWEDLLPVHQAIWARVEEAVLASARPSPGDPVRTALAPFVAHYQPWMDDWDDDSPCGAYARVTFGDLRRARAVISAPEGKATAIREIADLRGVLGEPFMTANSGCEGGPFVKLKFETLAEMQRAHTALCEFFQYEPAALSSVSTPTGEGEERHRQRIAEAICDGYSNGNQPFSEAPLAIQHSCRMAAEAVMALSRPVAERPAALAHPQQGGERDRAWLRRGQNP